jgi:hypothetical protein
VIPANILARQLTVVKLRLSIPIRLCQVSRLKRLQYSPGTT